MSDRGPWMQTYSGIAFYPLRPLADEVHIFDIAHALSMLCRFAGHARSFYSVAEHSILLAEAAPPELKLQALLHDAAEAYICDLPRGLKGALPEYKAIELGIEWVIRKRFGIVQTEMEQRGIKALDDRILEDERRALFLPPPIPWTPREPLGVSIRGLTPDQARTEFMVKFVAYKGLP